MIAGFLRLSCEPSPLIKFYRGNKLANLQNFCLCDFFHQCKFFITWLVCLYMGFDRTLCMNLDPRTLKAAALKICKNMQAEDGIYPLVLGHPEGVQLGPPWYSPKPTFFGPSWGIIKGSVEYHEKKPVFFRFHSTFMAAILDFLVKY